MDKFEKLNINDPHNFIIKKISPSLIDIINKFPEKKWDFAELSENPNITLKDILDNPNYEWNHRRLSYNLSIAYNDVINNAVNIRWDVHALAANFNFTIPLLSNLTDIEAESNEFWNMLSYNSNICLSDVIKYIDKPWDWRVLSSNMKLTEHDITAPYQLPLMEQSNTANFSSNPFIDINFVIKHYANDSCLSSNLNITYNHILSNPQIKWDYAELSKVIDIKDILKDIEINPTHIDKWYIEYMYENLHMTLMNIYKLSRVFKKSLYELHWDTLSINPTMSVDDLINLNTNVPELSISSFISQNPNLTHKHIISNIDNWSDNDFENLSVNKYHHCYIDYLVLKNENIEQQLFKLYNSMPTIRSKKNEIYLTNQLSLPDDIKYIIISFLML